jgi:hypothetical protein
MSILEPLGQWLLTPTTNHLQTSLVDGLPMNGNELAFWAKALKDLAFLERRLDQFRIEQRQPLLALAELKSALTRQHNADEHGSPLRTELFQTITCVDYTHGEYRVALVQSGNGHFLAGAGATELNARWMLTRELITDTSQNIFDFGF